VSRDQIARLTAHYRDTCLSHGHRVRPIDVLFRIERFDDGVLRLLRLLRLLPHSLRYENYDER
jgi:hypothetical protein